MGNVGNGKKGFTKSSITNQENFLKMNHLTAHEFFIEVETAPKINFSFYNIQTILQTEKSFKANIYLEKNIFIAVRYKTRNKRIDFALIKDNQRIFGYDNLKE